MLAGDDFSDRLQQRGVQLMRNAEIKQLALPARSREIAFVLQHGQIKPTTKRSDLLGNVVAAEGKRPPGEALAREHKQRGLLVVGKIKEERLVFVQQLLQLLGCERMPTPLKKSIAVSLDARSFLRSSQSANAAFGPNSVRTLDTASSSGRKRPLDRTYLNPPVE